MDDTRVPVSSHQHAVAAFALLEKVASEEQYLYKPGKNNIVASRFVWCEPIQLQGFMVQYVDSTMQLGYSIDHSFDGSSHLHHILARGNGKMIQLLADMKTLRMPMQALIHTFHTRLMPAILYGVELTVHVAKG